MTHAIPALHGPAIRHRHHQPVVTRRHLTTYAAKGHSETIVPASAARRSVWASWVAAAAAVGYALPHLWWVIGTSWMYPGDFADIADQSWPQVFGDLVITTLAIAWGLIPLALVRPWGRVLPRRLLVASAWVSSVALILWSLSYLNLRIMLATGRVVSGPEFAASDAHPAAAWGYYWYGLFLVWGISLGATAWWSRRAHG